MKKVYNILCGLAVIAGIILMFQQTMEEYKVITLIASLVLTLCAVTNLNDSNDYVTRGKVLRSISLYTLALGALWYFTPEGAWYVPLVTYVLFAAIGLCHVSMMDYQSVFGDDMPVPDKKGQVKCKLGLWVAVTMVVIFIAAIM